MATIYYVKNGPRPDNSGPGRLIELGKVAKIVQRQRINHKYLGTEPPQFNKDTPSPYPSYVVIEVEPSDTKSGIFSNVGFFLLLGLSPQQAEQVFSGAIGQLRL